MKWTYSKSWFERWLERSRDGDWSEQVVLAVWPKKIGYGEGAPVYWLSPVRRVRDSTSWKPTWCLDSGYSSWWKYSRPRPGDWSEWARRRPLHWLAGIVYLSVYWSWAPALIVGCFWGMHWITFS